MLEPAIPELEFDTYGCGLAHMKSSADNDKDCPQCHGHKFVGPATFPQVCPSCAGAGVVPRV